MNDGKTKTLVLLDAHALIHRAYHALPHFTSAKTGEPTGALYGLSSMLLRVTKELKPDYMMAAYDLPEPTFRHIAYENYKATRKETDDELKLQLDRSHDVVEAFGIPILSSPGFEADDILGTITEQIKKNPPAEKLKVIIVSGDMDVLQLVDGKDVLVYTMKRGIEDTITYDEDKVKERFGFSPEMLPDFKGLKGDPSDNIKGVKGVGEKTASELIKKFGSLEQMYVSLKKGDTKGLKERIANLLLENEAEAFFSKNLATIRKDVPVKFELPKAVYQVNTDEVKNIFETLGFSSLVQRLELKPASKDVEIPEDQLALSSRLVEESKEKFWEDLEASDTIFLLWNEDNFFVKGLGHNWVFEEDFFGKDREKWQAVFSGKLVVSFLIKDLLNILKKYSISKIERSFDCFLAAWVVESTMKAPTRDEMFSYFLVKHAGPVPMDTIDMMPDLYTKLCTLLREKSLEKIFYQIEMPLVPVLAEMEYRGIAIDWDFMDRFKKEISQRLSVIEEEIYKLAGTKFNINSPSQLGEILFNKLKISNKDIKKTKTGKISTRESELVKLRGKVPLADNILEYRELSKLLGTYIEPLSELSKADGRIHTTFNQTGTVTGRLSSESPNLQNIPSRSETGARIRDAFQASGGFTFVSFDYSQIELRILAAFSKDEKMIQAFKTGTDIHALTASLINNVPLEKVTSRMRSAAKTINFGIIYGMGVRQLAQNTGMTQEEAKKFYEKYFHDFPRIRAYMDGIKTSAKEKGYVETLFGRKRFFDLRRMNNAVPAGRRGFWEAEMERMAVNAVIQGTDADIVKKAMIDVNSTFYNMEIYPLLQIHDELVYEIRDDIMKKAIPEIKKIMENAVSLAVPLVVDVKTGKRLGSLQSNK
ncbi:DNA polymerase I [Candidatus Giovannonibacteria bacterium]|nr:DNA polymerase I [Candidatus Giovannonibacteria bacterium]